MSLHYDLKNYLDDQGWKGKYNIELESSKKLDGKAIVAQVKDSSKEIGMPLIIIGTGLITDRDFELGAVSKDQIQLTIIVYALNEIQLITLANLTRRRLKDNSFSVYNFSSGHSVPTTSVDKMVMESVVLTDYSDRNSNDVAERYVNVINAITELSSNSYS